jgi:hypothetical protein
MTKLIVIFFVNVPKHISALCGQNVELLSVKPGGSTYDHR